MGLLAGGKRRMESKWVRFLGSQLEKGFQSGLGLSAGSGPMIIAIAVGGEGNSPMPKFNNTRKTGYYKITPHACPFRSLDQLLILNNTENILKIS